MPITRHSLIVRLQSVTDQQAWEEFVQIYSPVILRVARERGLQDSDAQDIVQEVLGRLVSALPRWDPSREKGTFSGWLSRIAHNLVIDFLRHRKNPHVPLNNLDTAILQTPDRESRESQIFLLERERQLFYWAADRVRQHCQPKHWEAFWKSAVLRLPLETVVEDMKMTRGAIYVAKSRIMALIRREVQAHQMQESGESRLPFLCQESDL